MSPPPRRFLFGRKHPFSLRVKTPIRSRLPDKVQWFCLCWQALWYSVRSKRVESRGSTTARHALPGLIRRPSRASQALFAESRPWMRGSSPCMTKLKAQRSWRRARHPAGRLFHKLDVVRDGLNVVGDGLQGFVVAPIANRNETRLSQRASTPLDATVGRQESEI